MLQHFSCSQLLWILTSPLRHAAYQDVGSPGGGRVEAESMEMSAVLGGDPDAQPHSVRGRDRGRPVEVRPGKNMADLHSHLNQIWEIIDFYFSHSVPVLHHRGEFPRNEKGFLLVMIKMYVQ